MKATPPTASGLEKLSRDRLGDAKALYAAGRYEGSVYLCGYAIELALKARICSYLGWALFPDDITSMKTHSLEMLLRFTGLESSKNAFSDEWNLISTWTPEMRYDAEISFSMADAEARIGAAKSLLTLFL